MPHDHLGRIYLATGRYAEAVKEFRHGSVYQSMVPGFLGHALARCGDRDEARRLLAIAPRASAKALICLGLGAHEEALAWMEQSLEENDIFVKVFKVEPALDPLRSQPRFKALLQKAFFQGETA